MKHVSRRGLLHGLAAGALALGFDPATRSWITEARASTPHVPLPPLDGTLTADPAALAAFADDFGHMVHRTPVAVLSPGSVDDVAAIVRFARRHGLRVSGRGQGHTVLGQSQVEAGVIVDMRSLDQLHHVGEDRVIADAGARWRDILIASTAVGRTPPVVTGFTGTTVGGTLSVGGMSGRSFLFGTQGDNVIDVTVVTGEGEVVVCSPHHHPKLFNAVLAGLGLSAIIVRATLRLVPVKEMARTYRMVYPDVPALLTDLRALAEDPRFDDMVGQGLPTSGGFTYVLEGTRFFDPGEEDPDDLLDGLGFVPGSVQVEEQSYLEYTDIVGRLLDLLDQAGLGGLPHPWLDLMLPEAEMAPFATAAIASLDTAQLLPGSLLLFYVHSTATLNRPLFRVPDDPYFFQLSVLPTVAPDPAVVNGFLAFNRGLFEQARSLGGKHYTISAIPLSPADWKAHFHPYFGLVTSAKHRHDPDGVLGPGPGVFP